jgi:ribosomal protein S12 methylthiotransferase
MPVATDRRSVCLVSLGCSKNLVDSEVMVGHLARAGLDLVVDADDADLVVVNTCGFIDAAREESVDTILEYAELKQQGVIRGLVVTGCLVQLHAAELGEQIPEVDAFLPLSDYSGVPSIVKAVLGDGAAAPDSPGGGLVGAAAEPFDGANRDVAGGQAKAADSDLGRRLLTPVHTAYLRLGEGCNHVCAFCAIPRIRGKLSSKPMEVLLEEATALAALGTRELTLVAEDTTDYGKDLGAGYGLAELLEGFGDVPGLEWVRVMYAHPATFDDRLAEVMADVPNVVPYLDMPIQHGDADVLRAMRRGTNPDRIRDIVSRVRARIPELTLRTTILTGFPGETDAAHANLLGLLDDLRVDRVGCFVYSSEEGTEGAGLPGAVPRELAEARRDEVMGHAREVLEAANQARIGGTERLLVDAVGELAGVSGSLALGRTAREAPEVDGQVLVHLDADATDPEPGEFIEVKMTGVKGYDMVAKPVS